MVDMVDGYVNGDLGNCSTFGKETLIDESFVGRGTLNYEGGSNFIGGDLLASKDLNFESIYGGDILVLGGLLLESEGLINEVWVGKLSRLSFEGIGCDRWVYFDTVSRFSFLWYVVVE
ncbi:hypothetical protein COLO4_19410 [Corchorus olitorius]|uniref:Uncharacterized protein n=1 Tax=Corchorus olitorius TaxID=93759 RepID=A0A1R3J5H9_9ROSI|nr:hypothetical protein COLO4_19410 [Corchorus olitorius]